MNCLICGKEYDNTLHNCQGFIYPPQGAIPKPPYHTLDEEIVRLRTALAEKEKECERLKEALKLSCERINYNLDCIKMVHPNVEVWMEQFYKQALEGERDEHLNTGENFEVEGRHR